MITGTGKVRIEEESYIADIGVMENDEIRLKNIIDALESLKWRPRLVNNAREAVELVERGVIQFFILDIHMGQRHAEEGLDALEMIKNIDTDIFVCIYSAYLEKYQTKAEKLGVDLFYKKSGNVSEDMRFILADIFPIVWKNKDLIQIKGLSEKDKYSDNTPNNNSEEFLKNLHAFQEYMADEKWVSKNIDNYVGFVNGKLVGEDADQHKLVSHLITQFSDQAKFIARVEKEEAVEDVPTPDFVEE